MSFLHWFLRMLFGASAIAASGTTGAILFRHRERIKLACKVLRGHASESGNGFKCERQHVENGQALVDAREFENLKIVANEYMVAQGFIAAKDNQKFAEAVEQVTEGRK